MNVAVIYQDDRLIAINKPHGLLTHRSHMARDASEYAVQLVRDHIGRKVYPCHRLDRKTSGVLIFALDQNTNSQIQQLFMNGEVSKEYVAIVRGWTQDHETIDYPLTNDKGKIQDSMTHYITEQRWEIDLPHRSHATSRYSLVNVSPATGRYHQIRKHFAHIMHPILGDRPHGCNKQNKLWLNHFEMSHMMLHAQSVRFSIDEQVYQLKAKPSKEFERVKSILDDKQVCY